jgi:glycerol-3-phosphate acyltransferase PlsY
MCLISDPHFWLYAFLSYALGSIPFGLLLTKAFTTKDLREIGSGNIGATNVLRTGNKGLAAATLLLDIAKGYAAVYFFGDVAGMFAVLGHIYSVWLKFEGGKGVATLLGFFLAFDLTLGISFIIMWLFTFAVFRISSLSALVAITVSIGFGFEHYYFQLGLYIAVLGLIVIFRHEGNIRRLIKCEEPRFSLRKE